MVPAAWIYSIHFGFCSPQLHQHLHPHSTCHLNNKTYPLTPISTLVRSVLVTGITQPLQIKSSSSLCTSYLYTTTFPMYPLLTTSTLYWIITNTPTTYTTWPSSAYTGLNQSSASVCTLSLGKLLSFDVSPMKHAFYAACNSIFANTDGLNEMALLSLQEAYSLSVLVCSPCLTLEC